MTFEEHGGRTLVTFHELYPTTAALEEALAGSRKACPEQFAQLDELLAGGSGVLRDGGDAVLDAISRRRLRRPLR